jgi:hypothetical protein
MPRVNSLLLHGRSKVKPARLVVAPSSSHHKPFSVVLSLSLSLSATKTYVSGALQSRPLHTFVHSFLSPLPRQLTHSTDRTSLHIVRTAHPILPLTSGRLRIHLPLSARASSISLPFARLATVALVRFNLTFDRNRFN